MIHRFRLSIAAAIVTLPSVSLLAGDGALLEQTTDARFRIVESELAPTVLLENDGFVVSELTAAERVLATEILRTRAGDGGGATVEGLLLVQVGFANGNCPCIDNACNVVLMLWDETAFEPGGVDILVNGGLLGTLPGVPEPLIPGGNGVNITGVPAGSFAFGIASTSDDSADELTIEVLDDQPFSDPTSVTCDSGPADGVGTCRLDVAIENPGPLPTFYFVNLDGTLLGTVAGTATAVNQAMVPAGEHCVQVQGVVDNGDNTFYQGCEIESCCTIECTDLPCDAPNDLLICQSGYGDTDGVIRAAWTNGESPYSDAVTVLLDDAPLGALPGDATSATIVTTIGEHTVGIQGDCGPDGLSDVASDSITLLASTPHANPIAGDITETWVPDDGGTTTATWETGDPSAFIDVYVRSGGQLFFVGVLAGASTAVEITGTAEEDTIVLQFFALLEDGCYGSELLSAGTAFIRSDFNASADVDLSDPVATLNFLFLGGPPPTCEDAADSNNDGLLNVADPSYTLGFLFLGTPPPDAPFPNCGVAEVKLGCESFAPCE